jgi:hypothetical protein
MPRQIPQRDPIAANARKAAAQRRVGIGAKCACGEDRARALIKKENSIACAECARKGQGKTTMDNHHIAGKANSRITIPVPVNDHRARLSEDQYDWPKKTLENPNGSPLRAAAACIRGAIDYILYTLDTVLMWIAEMLEVLDEYLIERLGSKWWQNTPLNKFASGAGNVK